MFELQPYLGLTAIEAWVIACVLFVFGALFEYAAVLLKIKVAATRKTSYDRKMSRLLEAEITDSVVFANGSTVLKKSGKMQVRDVH